MESHQIGYRLPMETMIHHEIPRNLIDFRTFPHGFPMEISRNLSKAYFWRNDKGELELGVFDWGGMGCRSLGFLVTAGIGLDGGYHGDTQKIAWIS